MFLDSSFCVDLMREQTRGAEGAATLKLRELIDVPLLVSLFVLCELQAGAEYSASPQRELRKVERLVGSLELVLPDRAFAVACGQAEASLRRSGHRISTMDLLIGVTAKSWGMSLLARDAAHFAVIPGLVVESY